MSLKEFLLKINLKLVGVVLIFFILFSGIMFFMMLKKSGECANNPFVYGAKKVKKMGEQEILCTCNFLNQNYAPFIFDSESVRQAKDYSAYALDIPINISE